ncbi:MAG: DUF72 domain-containing protein [Solirubrobacteraceae bacterium]
MGVHIGTSGWSYQHWLDYFLARLPAWMRVAVEFRHPSWHDETVFALLERHQAAICVMSGANLPCLLRATAPFVYLRLHGPRLARSGVPAS